MCKADANNDPLDVRNKVQLDFMNVEIVDLFQRNAELLDRIIRLENRMSDAENVTMMYTPIGGAELPPANTAGLIDIKNPQVCHYCDLPKKYLKAFMQAYKSRWFRLTIDCKDNEAGYISGNLVLACDKCNSIKSNILSYEDMKFIGQTFIKPIWHAFFEESTSTRDVDEG